MALWKNTRGGSHAASPAGKNAIFRRRHEEEKRKAADMMVTALPPRPGWADETFQAVGKHGLDVVIGVNGWVQTTTTSHQLPRCQRARQAIPGGGLESGPWRVSRLTVD